MSVINTNLVQVLPYEPLTKIESDTFPSALSVRKLKKEIYANARSVPTPLGGGNHGHLGLVMTAAAYAALVPAPGAAFVLPDVPDALNFNGNAAAGTVALARAEHEEGMNTYNKCHSLERQLKNQLLKAVPMIFIEELEDFEHGFATVTTGQLLEHLVTNYGTLTPEDKFKNSEKLHTPWNPDTPLETLFNNVAEVRQIAAAGGDPISEPTAVRAIIANLKNSGLFSKALDEWRQQYNEAQQTMANVRIHFHAANKLRINENPTKRSEKAFAAQGKETNNTAPNTNCARAYCWTHGATFTMTHTSKTCNKRAEGHNENATINNMLGGNNTMMRSKGEVQIYKPKPRAPRNNNQAPVPPQEPTQQA
jgi:hypothetical protein